MKRSRFSGWIIGIAAVILIGAVVVSVWRSSAPDASAPQPSASPTPISSFVPSSSPVSSPVPSGPAVTPSLAPPSEDSVSADDIPLPKDRINDYIQKLNGSSYIKAIEVGTDNLEIYYYKDYAEYKQARPDTESTEADYQSVFNSADAVHQIIMEQSSLLFYEFPGIASLDISLPFNGTTYSASLTKGSIEKFYSTDFEQIQSDEQWRTQISDRYFTKPSRDAFAKRYIKTS